jgi:hypothetical protein
MPITPAHLGVGVAAKAVAREHFSIVVFGLTQVALDSEVLWYLMRWDPPFHRFWHTYLGATIVAVVLAFVGKPASQWIKGLWNRAAARCRDADLTVRIQTTWVASFTGAMFGAYSHILLDSLFHSDIEPIQPWSAANRFRGVINPHSVEIVCVVLGIVGTAWLIARARRSRVRS